mmetsp:Transcript_13275/g.24977  ORF Transcript_13275/g.24977 Transcript_13275/m.24977 type:complete len:351 (+) Transcript_13275:57-1109(+)
MASCRRLLLLAVVLSAGAACSCDPEALAPHAVLTSPKELLLQRPVAFYGQVLSVRPADGLPEDYDGYCAAAPHPPMTDEEAYAFYDYYGRLPFFYCDNRSGHFGWWHECDRPHEVRVLVSVGLTGVSDGEIVRYNCTKKSCGNCGYWCPEVGTEMLDSINPTQMFREMCESSALWRRQFGQWPQWPQGRVLKEELTRPRSAESRPIAVPVPIPFAEVTEHADLRSELLVCMVGDVLDALNAELPSLTVYDLKRANLTEDPQRRVGGTPASFLEVSFAMAEQRRADEAAARLRQRLSAPLEWRNCARSFEDFAARKIEDHFCYDGLTTWPKTMPFGPIDAADGGSTFPKWA